MDQSSTLRRDPPPMTADLVGRLRNRADLETKCGNRTESPLNAVVLLSEAADRIEALEGANLRLGQALEAIAEHPGPFADDACWSRVEDARAALAKDKSDG